MTIYPLSDLPCFPKIELCGVWLVDIVLEPLSSKTEVLFLRDLLVVCILR